MQKLDYETPSPKRVPGFGPFICSFLVGWLISFLILAQMDDYLHMRMRGHHGDGGVELIAAMAFPLGVVMAIGLRSVWGASRAGIKFGAIAGVLTALIGFVCVYVFF